MDWNLRATYMLLVVSCLAAASVRQGRAQPSDDSGDHTVTVEVNEISRLEVGGNIEINIGSGQLGTWVNGDNVDGSSTADLRIITNVRQENSRKVTVSASKSSGGSLQNLGLRVDAQFLPAGSNQLYSGELVLTDLGNGLSSGEQDLIGDLYSVDTREGGGPYLNYDGRVNADYDSSTDTVIQVEYTLTEE